MLNNRDLIIEQTVMLVFALMKTTELINLQGQYIVQC